MSNNIGLKTDPFVISIIRYYDGVPFKYTYDDDENGHYPPIYGYCDNFLEYSIIGTDHRGKDISIEYPFEQGRLELILLHPCNCTSAFKEKNKQLCHQIKDSVKKIIYFADTPMSLHYGFQNSVDMFELIEGNLALDVMEIAPDIKLWALQVMQLRAKKFNQ